MSPTTCDIGKYLQESCHKTYYVKKVGLKELSALAVEDRELLQLRLGCKIEKICFHHEQVYLLKYTHLFGQTCCDPFKRHKNLVRKALRIITLDTAKMSCGLLLPGKKICPTCETLTKNSCKNETDSDNKIGTTEKHIKKLNNSLQEIGNSPINMEQDTGRRPSRRAALVAAKKIFNTVRNLGISDNPADPPVNPLPSPKPASTPHPYARTKPKKPVNLDLQMDCSDDFLSPIQAQFLLKAQIQYNMVMKNLRELMACNVKVIQTDANGVPTVVTTAPSVSLKSGNVTVNSKSPVIKRVNTGSAVVVPMTLIQSPIIIT